MKRLAGCFMCNFDQYLLGLRTTIKGCMVPFEGSMKKQYLHLSAYACDECKGPVVSGSLGVRENEISRETDIRHIGAVCLSCGHRQSKRPEAGVLRQFPPAEWGTADLVDASNFTGALEGMLQRTT